MKSTTADRVYQTINYVVVSVVMLCSLFPLIYILGISFTSEQEWIERGARMLIPFKPTLSGYYKVFQQSHTFLTSFKISVLRTLVGTFFCLVLTMTTGYVLSRRGLPGKKLLLIVTLVTILFGGGLIPTFLVVKATGLYNTFWSLVIPSLVDSWGVLVFKQFFENLPIEVEESAYIDGASELTLMVKIAIPLSKPVMAAMGLFIAVGCWNSWFDAMIYIVDKDLKPLQLLLRNMFVNANTGYDQLKMNGDLSNITQRVSDTTLKMVITVIGTIPILMVYPFLQKYFTSGVYVGSVKG